MLRERVRVRRCHQGLGVNGLKGYNGRFDNERVRALGAQAQQITGECISEYGTDR